MMFKINRLAVATLVAAVLAVLTVGAGAQTRKIAFTVDDLPLNGPDIGVERLRRMTSKFLGVAKKNKIPMVGFVNEKLLFDKGDVDARIGILRMWVEAGQELGNHTFSHRGFASSTLLQMEDEFVRGETVTQMLMGDKPVRWFRHPFLQMGKDRATELAFRDFMKERGCTAVPVTTDSSDWMFLTAYEKALSGKDEKLRRKVVDAYVKLVGDRLDANERNARALAGREITHIMLLHINELNADNFDAVVEVFRKRGYQFVTVEEAMKDDFYRLPDNAYAPTSFWIGQWAQAKGFNAEYVSEPDFIKAIANGK